MSKEVAINKLINEAMVRKGVSLLMFSEIGSGKSEFLTRLSNNFKKTFWFSPLTDDFESFALLIAEKLFANDRENLKKIYQVAYCRSAFNNEHIILNHILDYIAGKKFDILFAFEQMGRLSDSFDWSFIERLIKHCPANLKIAVASDRFINLKYSEFENNLPMLVDEYSLPYNERFEQYGIADYINALGAEDKAFLLKFLPLDYIFVDFAETLYPNARYLLETLAKQPSLASERGNGMYKLSTEFSNYLSQVGEPSNKEAVAELRVKLGEYYLETGKYFKALKSFMRAGNLYYVNKVIEFLLADRVAILKMSQYAATYCDGRLNCDVGDYPYYSLFVALSRLGNGDSIGCADLVRDLLTVKNLPKELFFIANSANMRALVMQKKFKEAFEFSVDGGFGSMPQSELFDTEDLLCLTLESIVRGDLPIDLQRLTKYEKMYADSNHGDEVWYVRLKEQFANCYYHVGNYRHGLDLQNEIRNVVPFYTMPHATVNYLFYAGNDINEIKETVEKAIIKAENWDISQDISLLYAALGRVNGYIGKKDEAIKCYDKAASLEPENTRIKFQNLAEKIVAYAKWRDLTYAKELAHVYLKYTQTYCSAYSYVLFYALSFCYYLQGDYDAAHRFAMECVKNSQTKSVYWLVSMAIASGYMLKRNAIDNPLGLVANILRTAENYGMDSMLVENIDIFAPIFEFSKNNLVAVDYVNSIEERFNEKNKIKTNTAKLRIKLFGTTGVWADGHEVAWKTKKAKELFLHYFIAGVDGIERAEIIDMLWNGYRYDSAINNLKTTNNIIRNTLDGLGVSFRLDYYNSKYVMTLNDVNSDASNFEKAISDIENETNLRRQAFIMSDIMKLYNERFGEDMRYAQFEKREKVVVQKKIFWLLKIVKGFLREGDYVEAKRFFEWLQAVDSETDYGTLGKSINERLGEI